MVEMTTKCGGCEKPSRMVHEGREAASSVAQVERNVLTLTTKQSLNANGGSCGLKTTRSVSPLRSGAKQL